MQRSPFPLTVAGLLAALAGASLTGRAQGILASGQIVGTPSSGQFDYSMSVSDGSGAGSSIGSFWYAWTPGQFYLPSVPTSPLAPSGWTASVVGHSIQFSANDAAHDIAPGGSLGGFGFTSTDTPVQLAGNAVSQGFPGTPVGTTVAYSAGFFSSPSQTFVFNTVVPEPAPAAVLGLGLLCWLAMRRLGPPAASPR